MPLDQFAERNAHRLFDVAGPLDLAGNAVELRAGIIGPSDAGKPGSAAAHDVRHLRDGLDVVHRGWAAVESHIGREWRLEPRHSLLAFETFQERGFLAADIGAGAMVHDDVEIEAVDIVLADELGVISLLNCSLKPLAFANEFTSHIDVASVGRHRAAGDQAALDEKMRIVSHDLAILAGPGFRLVGIDDEIMRTPVGLLRHERPFQSGRKSRAAAPALPRRLDFIDDSVAAASQNFFGAVPGTAAARAVEAPIVLAVEIFEDAVLVREH